MLQQIRHQFNLNMVSKDKQLRLQSDDFSETITNLVQDAVDALIYGLTTQSTTKPLNVGTPNTMIESQRMLSNSQFLPDLSDTQVQNHNAMKAPVKRDRKKSGIFRSPYLTKFDSSSKGEESYDNEVKQKYAFESFTIAQELPTELMLDYSK
ncbi:hypothetical protein CQW23_28197 [Capsicum baccatum]|uniref:Uncharacterized protein n=1 Tax=Capsicum baccatum TaxID=33114 RepID=A0A2G2VFU3_CAPBA|nr:hypothetical protein CQW23_28197 [Capsicum baccatum]